MKILKYHLEKSDIETACHFVEEYNLNPDLIKGELVDLQFLKDNPLIQLTPSIKA